VKIMGTPCPLPVPLASHRAPSLSPWPTFQMCPRNHSIKQGLNHKQNKVCVHSFQKTKKHEYKNRLGHAASYPYTTLYMRRCTVYNTAYTCVLQRG